MKNSILLLFISFQSFGQFYLNDSVWFDTTYIPGASYGADIGKWDPKTHPFFADIRQNWQVLSGYNEGDTTPWGIQHYDNSYELDSMEQKIITWGNPRVKYTGDWTLSEDCLCAWNNKSSDRQSTITYTFYGFDVRFYGQSLPHLGQFIFELDGDPYLVDQSLGTDSLAMNIGFFDLDTGYHTIVMRPLEEYMVFKWLLINYQAPVIEEPAKLPTWVYILLAVLIAGIIVYLIVRK